MNNFNSPAEVAELMVNSSVTKASLTLPKMFLLAIMSGIFIAFGAEASNVAMHNISDVGLARLVAGCVFPAGLMMVVLLGAELFTGNCLMVGGVLARKIRWSGWVKSLVTLWIGNLVGSLIVVFIVASTTQLGYSDNGLGAFTINVALGKVNLSFSQALISGIGCNILVCIAVLLAFAAKDVPGKILGIFFPICAFVISGFEHCVANMYYIPAGIVAATNSAYVEAAQSLYGVTSERLATLSVSGLFGNLVPVTIGNMIGGIFIGVVVYFCHKSKSKLFARPEK